MIRHNAKTSITVSGKKIIPCLDAIAMVLSKGFEFNLVRRSTQHVRAYSLISQPNLYKNIRQAEDLCSRRTLISNKN